MIAARLLYASLRAKVHRLDTLPRYVLEYPWADWTLKSKECVAHVKRMLRKS